jgi:hypothetical protein
MRRCRVENYYVAAVITVSCTAVMRCIASLAQLAVIPVVLPQVQNQQQPRSEQCNMKTERITYCMLVLSCSLVNSYS